MKTATRIPAQCPGREGSALILTVTFVLLTGIVTGALLSAAVTHRRLADRSYQRERAFNLAEAGLEAACQLVSARGDLLHH
jgi:Tfp pilus assembly protein PilX